MLTHVLNYKISNEPTDKKQALAIRKYFKLRIWNIRNIELVELHDGDILPVAITWKMPNAGLTCAYYYSGAGEFYSAYAIQVFCKQLLQGIADDIRTNHPEYGIDWGIAYLVTKVVKAEHLQLENFGFQGPIDDEDEDEDKE